jgi:hypothetical protein
MTLRHKHNNVLYSCTVLYSTTRVLEYVAFGFCMSRFTIQKPVRLIECKILAWKTSLKSQLHLAICDGPLMEHPRLLN